MSGFPYHHHRNQQNPPRIMSPARHAVGHFDGSSFRPSFPQEFRQSVPENQQSQKQYRQQYQSNLKPRIAREQLPFGGDFRPQQQTMDSYNSDTFRPTGSTPRIQEQNPSYHKQGFLDRQNMDSYNNQTGQIRPNYSGTFGPPGNFPRTLRLPVHDPNSQKQGFWDRNNPAATDFQRNMDPTRDISTHNESMNNYSRGNVAARNSFQNLSNETQSSFSAGSTRQPPSPNVMPPTFNIQRPVNMPCQNIQHHMPPSMQQQNFQMMRQPCGLQADLPWTQNRNATKFSSSPVSENAAISVGFLQKQKTKEEADMDRNFIEDWLAKRKISKEQVLEKPKTLKVSIIIA